MAFLILSFIAGVLTVLAPCVLPILPVILGGTATDTDNRRRPLVIIGALAVSVFVFTLLLKASTALIMIPPAVWAYVSGAILLAFGLTLLFPEAWARLLLKVPGHNRPDAWLSKGYSHKGAFWGDALIGAALGPIFTTCSPTFFVILATVLPQSLAAGLANLAAYVIGLALILLLIARLGQRLVSRLEWAADPKGWFKRALGAIFVILAILIATGIEKKIETALLDVGFLDPTSIERYFQRLLERPTETEGSISGISTSRDVSPGTPAKAVEIRDPAGFVNSEPFELADLIGDKVILLDFMTYSCINCQRTFPYLNDWYAKYKDQGLEIVAIHTPEFAFEKDIDNVREAASDFGLEFPLVLDNDYETWNAYNNRYWPHKYLIDIDGNIIYDHIGEGGYDETEHRIVELLMQRKVRLGSPSTMIDTGGELSIERLPSERNRASSPETYFGALRNRNFGNGRPGTVGEGDFEIPQMLAPDAFYLGGLWKIEPEYAESAAMGMMQSRLSFVFEASKVFIVAGSSDGSPIRAKVLIDGASIPGGSSGADVEDGIVSISDHRLYELFVQSDPEPHRIDIIFEGPGGRVFTFTFG